MKDSFLPDDLRLFRIGKKKVLQSEDNTKQQWMKSVKKARLRKVDKSEQRSRKRDNDLMSWINAEKKEKKHRKF